MANIRTDLAVDICESVLSNNSKHGGIECSKEKSESLEITRVKVTNAEGEKETDKPMGEYVTVATGKLWMDERELFKKKVYEFSEILKNIIEPKMGERKSILIAGLGNNYITADAIGPQSVKNIIVTRHIRSFSPLVFEELGLFDVCAITPGVLGQTGIESADIIKSVVEKIKPGILIAIDALASRRLERLVTTVQISDSGINPGSGVGNSRPEINLGTMGIPVISIGVPTVVDAATLAGDVIESETGISPDYDKIRKNLSDNELNFFVTPKESDQIINYVASFIGYGINLALNPKISYEDMLSLIGG